MADLLSSLSRAGGTLLGALAMLVLADTARAATFTVDSQNIGADIAINGVCDSDGSVDTDCTLNAAVDEANATSATDTINLNFASTTGGDPDDVNFLPGGSDKVIPAPPPPITNPVLIDGGDCAADPDDPTEPCVSVESGWKIDSPGEVRINGVAIFGTLADPIGIRIIEANGTNASLPDFMLTGSWFGLNRNGGTAGALLEPAVQLEDVDGARIGSGFVTDRNLFAVHSLGLDILGADNTEIFGNRFGLLPDGSFAHDDDDVVMNGPNIEITGDSAPTPDDPATGNVVGASSSVAAATPECDFGCNLITFAGIPGDNSVGAQDFAGIDFAAEAGEGEIPVDGAAVLGNEISNNGSGVEIGDADNVTIGGSAAGDGDRNLLSGNEIESDIGATAVSVENNVITNNRPDASIDLKGRGEVVGNFLTGQGTSAAIRLSDTTGVGYEVQGNVLGENEDGSGAALNAFGIDLAATASGNLIGGTGAGEGNIITEARSPVPPNNPTSTGIRIAGDDNEIVGNRIGVSGNGLTRGLMAGIVLETDADDNVVGGDTEASENEILNAVPLGVAFPGNAITVSDATSDGNLILRNRGSANEGLFIDLGDDGAGNLAEPNGPNGGIQAPAITTATTVGASGTAAPGASVRMFTKASASPGELEGFLAQATADGSGAWTMAYPAQTTGDLLAATATTATGTSEVSATATLTDPPIAPDTDPPETSLTKTPKKVVNAKKKGKATYTFGSDEPGSTFTCKVDRKPAASCSSPLKLKKLKKGKHTLSVFATDAAGNADPTPATHKFKIKPKRKP